MFKRILIPLDGSSLAECTIPYALAFQRAFSPRVILFRVLDPGDHHSGRLGSVDWRLEREAALQYLEDVAKRFGPGARESGRVEVEVVTGPASVGIVEMIRRSNIDLVLLSTHGAGGLSPFAVGGTAYKVASVADASVLMVRAGKPAVTDEPARLERILVAVDGSSTGDWAAHVAATIAGATGGELLLTHVISPPERFAKTRMASHERRLLERLVEKEREEGQRRLERLATQVGNSEVVTRTQVEIDRVAPALDEIAAHEKQSLIVLGAHGRASDCPWHYGSVATSLIQHGSAPVLILQDAPRRFSSRPSRRSAGHSSADRHASYAWSP